MFSYKPVDINRFAGVGSKFTEDQIYWKKYTDPFMVKEFGPIDYIDFSPVEPHNFMVTSSVRLQVYDPITKLVTNSYSRFKEAAYGGSFRKDGKLLCAGGEEAVVRLFNINSTNALRHFFGHKAAVHRVLFTEDVNIVSFSDDRTVILWDIASEKQVTSFNDHSDYIRAGAVNSDSVNMILSGGYDKHIHMYDTRANEKVLSVSHDAPVESLLFLPGGEIFLSAGGTDIKVWDITTGGKLLGVITQHHKTVTCLKLASNGRRILSSSLDKHVKVFDSATFETLHNFDYPNSVLNVGISADDQTIVAGMVDGTISIRRRKEEKDKVVKINRRKRWASKYTSEYLNTKVDFIKKQDGPVKHKRAKKKSVI